MQNHVWLSLFSINMVSSLVICMQGHKGPMNAEWFYKGEDASFYCANVLHQNNDWKNAHQHYIDFFADNKKGIPAYDRLMCNLNMGACLMAMQRPTTAWTAFDLLIDIPEDKQLPPCIETCKPGNTILVRSDQVGIGDIFHFLTALDLLKKKTGLGVIFSVRNFLHSVLSSAVKAYGIKMIPEGEPAPEARYHTHIVSLLGHLNIRAKDLLPKEVVFIPFEKALGRVIDLVDPILSAGKRIGIVFLGENRQATLIGGKQLPRDITQHGRHLSSVAFELLLKNNPDLVLLDCGTKDSKVTVGSEQNRVFCLANEERPFDTIVALGRIMSACSAGVMVGFGADNGPTNVFSRALDIDAQNCMSFIIPNAKEYDMRMEGEGDKYRQMLSNCWVYKCESPEMQCAVVERAYRDMVNQ